MTHYTEQMYHKLVKCLAEFPLPHEEFVEVMAFLHSLPDIQEMIDEYTVMNRRDGRNYDEINERCVEEET